jgi:hypothetical protein
MVLEIPSRQHLYACMGESNARIDTGAYLFEMGFCENPTQGAKMQQEICLAV